ncbi:MULTISPECIES: GNAT family N-acetyltransferase [unclassified Bradyrhizobium]|uniref:GNAT family N-acetyltransferase n=1 Tax=unclassified Bradyrhizobium TaxID=2631580 RepID=UPI001FF8134E|nr:MULTISPECIES: GNAT family N-acetyltransferase [unclassified Bradyrhizobium]MCK1714151.1 GNAT family N-acetyltransferase [Bradyrhizobium sp. 143]MCK1725242.1 GNAT family N-acetyltransferase [Bradyrhizobium sp. 142]
MQIRTGDTFDPRVVALFDHHITAARAQTAPGSAHALDLAGLRAADVAFWTGWDGEMLVATGALKALSVDHGEVKSMHTARAARQRGFGGRMLRHIIAEARARGMTRLSLETGSWDYFKPAHVLYRAHGFVPCGPFEGYVEDPNSLFLTLELSGG